MNKENIIVKTKLNSPRINKNVVIRKGIDRKLKKFQDYKLIIITAPAGYGKTTTAASFLARSGIPSAWYSIDREDNDPATFWGYVLASLSSAFPPLKIAFEDLLVNRELVESNILVGLIINKLDLLPGHAVLVLDDFHLISDEIVNKSLAHFVQHLPDNLSLVILSRRTIALNLAGMLSKGQAINLEGSDLEFSIEETGKFYRQRGKIFSSKELSFMRNFTEGWAAGLVLTSLAMEGQANDHEAIRRLSSQQIDRLLEEEVIVHWSGEIQDFLLRTSVLERFSAPLCQAVTGLKNCNHILKGLAKSNSFIIPLDQKGEWFRYHYLFKEFLYSRLEKQSREFILTLYRNAGDWYLENGFKIEAMDALIKGEDYKKALDLYWQIHVEMSRGGQLPLMLRWLGSIPAKYHRNGPIYCFIYAFLLTMDNQIDAGQKWAARGLASFNDPNGYVEDGVSQVFMHKLVLVSQADMYIRSGDAAGAAFCYAEASRSRYSEPVIIGELNSGQPAMLRTHYGFYGRLNLIKEAYLAPGVDLSGIIGDASAYLTQVLIEKLYERNLLTECRNALFKGVEEIFALGTPGVIVPYFITLAKLKWAGGDMPGAFAALSDGQRKLGEGRAYWHYLLNLTAASMYLDMNNVKLARERLDLNRLSIYDDLSQTREFEHIILARYLLQSGRVDEAILLFTRLLNLAEKENRLGSRIELLCHLGIACQQRGDMEKALDSLGSALELGMGERYVRTFIDKMERMVMLLKEYLKDASFSTGIHNYAWYLLAEAETSINTAAKVFHPLSTTELTRREYRILNLLAEKRSNEYIARELGISVRTVKYHNANLYRKLASNNRVEALIKAREAGLLE